LTKTCPVRWGFIGAGRHAMLRTAPAAHQMSGGRLYAAAARDPARAAALEPEVVFDSYSQLVEDPDVEAVYISIANNQHYQWAMRALECGKAVLCEKPLTMSLPEADRLLEVAGRHGQVLVEALWYRWHARIRAAESLIAQGYLGTAQRATAVVSIPSLDIGGYRVDASAGGGVLYDLGPYAISAILWGFGWADVIDVCASSRVGPHGVDTWTQATLRFASGIGKLLVCSDERRESLVIRGESGSLELGFPSFAAAPGDETELTLTTEGAAPRRISFAADDAYRRMFEDVSSRVRGGGGYVVPLEQSRATMATMDWIRRASISS
jgi:xylose dehydrogenase (NAD/NADP)